MTRLAADRTKKEIPIFFANVVKMKATSLPFNSLGILMGNENSPEILKKKKNR